MKHAQEMMAIYADLDDDSRKLLLAIGRGMIEATARRKRRPNLSLAKVGAGKTVVNLFDHRVDNAFFSGPSDPIGD